MDFGFTDGGAAALVVGAADPLVDGAGVLDGFADPLAVLTDPLGFEVTVVEPDGVVDASGPHPISRTAPSALADTEIDFRLEDIGAP